MAMRYRYAGVFTLTTFTIILNEELCSAEKFQPEQNRSYQCPTFFQTSCIFRNWTHRYSVSIFKTDDSQDCRPGLAERCSRPRLKMRRGPPRSGGKDSPNGAYRSAGPGRQPSQNFVPRKRFKSHRMHQIANFVPQKRFNRNKLHHRQEMQEIPPKRQQL